jgi:hypothetical protein
MTKHTLVKNVADNDGAADCSCNEMEAPWHIMGMGSCSSYPTIRKRGTLECVKK